MTATIVGKRRALIMLSEADVEQLLDLPDGYQVHHIGADFLRSSIVIAVESDDLEPVYPGVEPPLLHGAFSREQVVVDGELYTRWAWSAEAGA